MTSFFKVFILGFILMPFLMAKPVHAVEGFDKDLSFEAEEYVEEPGVGIGMKIPHDLKLPDNRGRMRSFDELKGRNGIVLFFVRSAVWSPYCIFQLRELSQRGSVIEDQGYNIVVLSYDSIRKLSIFAKEHEFAYPILSDRGSVAIQAFRLLNDEYDKGTTYYGVPHPAVYVMGSDGLILHKFFNENFKIRPSVTKVSETLAKLGDYEPIIEYYEDFD